MEIKKTVGFTLRKYDGKNPHYQIRMRVSFNKTRVDYPLGFSINTSVAWDEQNQLVKKNYIGNKNVKASTINERIALFRTAIEDCFKYFEVNDIMPSTSDLNELFNKKVNPSESVKQNNTTQEKNEDINIWTIYDKFIKESTRKNDWSIATIKKITTLKNDLLDYNKHLTFDKLNENGLTNFVYYLREKKSVIPPKALRDENGYIKGERFGLKNTTIEKKIKFLKWFLNWATKKGYNSNIDFMSFKPALKTATKPIIYLTEDEMNKLKSLQLTKKQKNLEQVRDVFRFCCVTGLRYSDVYNMRRSNIKEDHIELVTQKTTDRLSIPLNKPAKEILDKYKDVPYEDDKALPVITNQKTNSYIRSLCKLAKIDTPVCITTIRGNTRTETIYPKYKLMSSHAGRRTFICTALSKGVSAEVVMKITGHSSYQAMKPYIAIAESAKNAAVTALDDF